MVWYYQNSICTQHEGGSVGHLLLIPYQDEIWLVEHELSIQLLTLVDYSYLDLKAAVVDLVAVDHRFSYHYSSLLQGVFPLYTFSLNYSSYISQILF